VLRAAGPVRRAHQLGIGQGGLFGEREFLPANRPRQ